MYTFYDFLHSIQHIYLRSQQVLDTKDTRGILGFKENMTRIQWYVDLIDCAIFSNLFGLTIPITFILVHSMKHLMPCEKGDDRWFISDKYL